MGFREARATHLDEAHVTSRLPGSEKLEIGCGWRLTTFIGFHVRGKNIEHSTLLEWVWASLSTRTFWP